MSEVGSKVVDVDVVIVGAGISGLTAAYTIHTRDPGIRLVVIEAKDRIGGRTVGQTLKTVSGLETWDLGGQWVGSCQGDIMQLLNDLKMSTYPQYTTGSKIMQLGDTERTSTYTSEIPSLPFLALIDLFFFMRRVDKMYRLINVSDPSACHLSTEWDAITLEEFKQKYMWTSAAKRALDAAVRCIFGTEACDISLLYYLTYVAAAGGLDPLLSSRKNYGGQELKVVEGAWKICHRLSEVIGHSNIQLNAQVLSIKQGNGADSVRVETAAGKIYKCRKLIMAVPPTRAVEIEYHPPLPVVKQHVWQRMPAGNITKIIVSYKTAFWKTAGLSGEAVTVGGKSVVSGCIRGPLCIVFDATSANDNPALVSFIGGQQQLQYANVPGEERRRAVLHNLAELFGPEALQPLDYCEKNWNEEMFCGGGPVSVCTTGAMIYASSALRQPLDKIHFAGTETATRWCGFMNGAVQSGRRAAMEVLYNIRPQAVNAADLDGTVYDVRTTRPNTTSKDTRRRSTSTGCSWLWRPLTFGFLAGVAIYVGRRFSK